MSLKNFLFVSITAAVAALSACSTTTERFSVTESDGRVTVYEKTTSQLLIGADMELTYDALGRPVYRFKITDGPHTGDSYNFPSKQDALDRIPGILRNGIWGNGEKVTEEDISELLEFIDTNWVEPGSGA